MAVQVQQPQRRRRDVFDVLLGGLQAAASITNIQKARAELEAIPEAKARLARAEERQFAGTFAPVPAETPGAVTLTPPGEGRDPGTFVTRAELLAGAKAKKAKEKETKDIQEKRLNQFKQIQDDLRKDKNFQKASAKVFDARNLINLGEDAMAGNQASFNQMKVIVARMNQGGVLTDRDIALLGGSQEWSQVLDRFLDTKLVGTVRPEDVEDILDVAKAARDSGFETAKILREGAINRAEKRFGAAGVEVDRRLLEDITEINDVMQAAALEFPKRTTPVRRRGILPGGKDQNRIGTPEEQESEFDSLMNILSR